MENRIKLVVASALMCLPLLSGCGGGDNPGGIVDPDGGGVLPFAVFQIASRPLAIQRASESQNLPNPQLGVYNLTAFFEGGGPGPTFDWQLNQALGTLRPKTEELTVNDATVVLVNDGTTPLGFYDITVMGQSASERDTITARFAVIENTWMKHSRARIGNIMSPPANLVFAPTYIPGDPELILYIESPTGATVNLRSIQSYASLEASEQMPQNVFITPSALSQQVAAAEDSPDFSPAALGRDEIMFSSQLDINANERTGRTPFNLWVVKRPTGISQREPSVVTFDSTFIRFGSQQWYAFDYLQPRWDPSATVGQAAPIAFIATIGATREVWLADLMDLDMDTRSDTLVNYRQLTTGGASSFSWHPTGDWIYYTRPGLDGISRINVDTGAIDVTTFVDKDSVLTELNYVTVFQRPGENTLVAFQGNSENRINLYVYDEVDDTLSRILPFSFSVTHNLFPRWHPTRKELVYVSDYSVNAWSDNVDVPPIGNAELFGQRRTQDPSVWSVRLEDVQ